MKDSTLDQIKIFADRAHGDQMRKYTPERYMVHPVRVMETVKDHTTDISILAASLLHDVLEDTPVPSQEIENFLQTLIGREAAHRTVQIVRELTDIYTKKNYPQWNRYKRKQKETSRLEKASAEAQTIKYADLIDNSLEIVKQDPDFAKRYLEEARILLARLKKGNPHLRQRALETINKSFQELDLFTSKLKSGNLNESIP